MMLFPIFLILSIPIAAISARSIFDTKNHGFYRFFSWECILWLIISNIKYWFYDPLSLPQILSWSLLIVAFYLAIAGFIEMKKKGKAGKNREDSTLYEFERTSELVESGIFKYIRHPMYSSLIFLTWGIFFKNATYGLLVISALSSLFLILTSIFDEKECIGYFGEKYRYYMKRSKRFIPYII